MGHDSDCAVHSEPAYPAGECNCSACDELHKLRAALALPEDSKTVNAELYGLAVGLADSAARSDIECVCATAPGGGYWIRGNDADVDRAARYLSLREASGEPMPYKIIREGDKVRFE